MQAPESQTKDSQLMRLLEQPAPPPSSSSPSPEKAPVTFTQSVFYEDDDDDMFMFTRSTLNFITELWNSNKSLLQNLKILLGFLQSYMTSQGKLDPNVERVREAKIMKDALINILEVLKKKKKKGKGCSTSACTLPDLNIFFIEENLISMLSEDIMTDDTFHSWVQDFKLYISHRPSLRVGAAALRMSTSSRTAPATAGEGMNALFSASCIREEETDERLPQYVAKSENGRVYTVRTPGEIGHFLIRLDVYEVRDILRRDKRDWWKYAKLRAQVLTSSSTDPKYELVKQLLDVAADDLIEVSGLRREISGAAQ